MLLSLCFIDVFVVIMIAYIEVKINDLLWLKFTTCGWGTSLL